jgi:hypothetical protein
MIRRERQERHIPRTLDLAGHNALMLGARARLATRADLASVRDIAPQ